MVSSIHTMNAELRLRSQSAGRDMQCGCGGSYNAKIAVVGVYPGQDEVLKGEPLVGATGGILTEKLQRYNMAKHQLYLTNAVKCKPLTEQISKADKEFWYSLLRWELLQLPNLEIIFIMGELALEALTDKKGITNWRGSVINIEIKQMFNGTVKSKTFTAVIANNPALIFRDGKQEIPFELDVQKLINVYNNEHHEYNIEHLINPTFHEAMDWIKKMKADNKPVSFDIEVAGKSLETICLGLTNDKHIGMCIPFQNTEGSFYSIQEEVQLWEAIQNLVDDEKVRLVAQNGMFDCYFLYYKNRIRVRRVWLDTLLAHHTLYPTLPHSLAFLTSQYTDHPFYKDDGKLWAATGDIDEEWRYNVKDVCITLAVSEAELSDLKAQEMDKFFFDHVMRLQPHLYGMTARGIKIDANKKDQWSVEFGNKVEATRQQFVGKARSITENEALEINLNSPKQMQQLYFGELKLIGRGNKTDRINRDRMLAHPNTSIEAQELIHLHNEYSEGHKFLSTYVNSKVDQDQRIRCEWKQFGVQSAPGRLSSSKVMWGSGMNLQNQPKSSFDMFIADEGYMFVYLDMEQIEARLVGWEAQIDTWIEQFERARKEPGSYDAHRALASQMFNIPYDDVPKSDYNEDGTHSIRYTAKRCRHGLNYRMLPDRLAQVLKCSVSHATMLFNIYHRTTPEIKEWWEATEREATTKRTLFTVKGRRWIALERLNKDSLSSVVAFRPQSTAGDHVSGAIYKCHEDDEWPKDSNGNLRAAIVLNIHDALIAICKPEDHITCMKIMRKYAEEPLIIHGRELIIPAAFKVSQPDENGVHRLSTLKGVNFDEYVRGAA